MAAFFGADEIWNIQNVQYSECSEEPVILVGVYNTDGSEYASEKDFYHSLDELAELSKACNMTPIYTITQQLPQVDKALYVRSGKAEEIAFYAEDMEAERIIFNDTLSPSQIRNLQKVIKRLSAGAVKSAVMNMTALNFLQILSVRFADTRLTTLNRFTNPEDDILILNLSPYLSNNFY